MGFFLIATSAAFARLQEVFFNFVIFENEFYITVKIDFKYYTVTGVRDKRLYLLYHF